MDEPFNGLDPKALAEFKNNVRQEIIDDKSTLLISSHALKELLYFCNRYIFIKSGCIYADIKSSCQNIETQNAFVEIISPNEVEQIQAFLNEDVTYVESANKLYFSNNEKYEEVLNHKVFALRAGETVLENIYLSMS